jgi:asparagine synthase (glutamine-hydrolysing)
VDDCRSREPEWFSELDRAFEHALRSVVPRGPSLTVLFSGGVDSSVLACGVRGRPGVRLFTIGAPGAPDLEAAESAAGVLGLAWRSEIVEPGFLERLPAAARAEVDDLPAPGRAIFRSLALALLAAPPGDLVCGQGADELFLGYAHFRGLTAESAAACADQDLRRLREEDWPRTARLAGALDRTISAPFLEPGFVASAGRIPIECRMPGLQPKALFRRWATHRGVPPEVANRPKRALQYGTRIHRWP